MNTFVGFQLQMTAPRASVHSAQKRSTGVEFILSKIVYPRYRTPVTDSWVRVGFDPIPSHRRRPRGGDAVGREARNDPPVRAARTIASSSGLVHYAMTDVPRCGGPARNQFRETAVAEQDHGPAEEEYRGQRATVNYPSATSPNWTAPPTKKEKGTSCLSISREGGRVYVCVCVEYPRDLILSLRVRLLGNSQRIYDHFHF